MCIHQAKETKLCNIIKRINSSNNHIDQSCGRAMKTIHFLNKLVMIAGVVRLTCAGLNETELRAGRAARSCVALRPSKKGRPSRGRSGESSTSRAAPSEEGPCSSVVFSNKLESCSWQQEHKNNHICRMCSTHATLQKIE